ncbi:MAG: hypothetical protein ACXWB9_07660 [Flavisolibacter sp.]
MKRFNLLSMAIAAILMVVAVGCTTLSESQDDRYARTQGTDRIYVDDPYRGLVILERDPYSGRYYEINSRSIYNNGYYRGGRYADPYGRRYNNNNRNYRGGTVTQPRPTEQQREETQKNRNEARNKVLGN